METFAYSIAYWLITGAIGLAGLMAWGRINDKINAQQKAIEELKLTVAEVQKETSEIVGNYKTRFEEITKLLNAMQFSLIEKLDDLRDHMDEKFVTKEMCAVRQKVEGL